MVKHEKIDFEELPSLFENKEKMLDLSDEEVLNALRNQEIFSDMDRSDQFMVMVKTVRRSFQSQEFKNKVLAIVREKERKKR